MRIGSFCKSLTLTHTKEMKWNFPQKNWESFLYNTALAITGAISWKTLPGIRTTISPLQALDETLMLTKVPSNKVPKHIYELIPPIRHSFWNSNSFTVFPCRTEYFKNSCFRYIHSSTSYLRFRDTPINFIRSSEKKQSGNWLILTNIMLQNIDDKLKTLITLYRLSCLYFKY